MIDKELKIRERRARLKKTDKPKTLSSHSAGGVTKSNEPLDLTQTTGTSDVEYIECECDLTITDADFEAATDFIADLLLRNYLQEELARKDIS